MKEDVTRTDWQSLITESGTVLEPGSTLIDLALESATESFGLAGKALYLNTPESRATEHVKTFRRELNDYLKWVIPFTGRYGLTLRADVIRKTQWSPTVD